MKKNNKFFLACLSGMAFFTVGCLLLRYGLINNAVLIGLITVTPLPLVFFLLNIYLTSAYTNKINKAKVEEMNAYLLRHKQEAEATSCKMLKKLSRLRRISVAYSTILGLAAACASILGAVLYNRIFTLSWILMFYSIAVFYVIYGRSDGEKKIETDASLIILTEKDFPLVYNAARRAADKLDCQGDIVIALAIENQVTIVKNKGGYILYVGAMIFGMMSEDELFSIFVHEFSHMSKKNHPQMREARYNRMIEKLKVHPAWLIHLVSYLDVKYLFDHMIFSLAQSVVAETEADRDMAAYSDPAAAASSLLKLNYDDLLGWESDSHDQKNLYESETLTADYFAVTLQKYNDSLNERRDDWNAMLSKEILSNNATHPTVRMRLETLGVTEFKTLPDQSSEEYRSERNRILEFAEARLYEDRQKNDYEQARRERYLEPMGRVTEWESNGMPITVDGYADIISDLRLLGRNRDAEAVCDRAIAELNENSSLHAYFIKGCYLLSRYDEHGIELLYRAVENNSNYIDEGLHMIGCFCCMTGREKELEEYRAKASQLMQKDKDENSHASILTKNDRLSKEELPEGMLEDILSFIHSVDSDVISEIYLVKKTVSDSFFTSAFVIRFEGGDDKMRYEIMHKVFRYLDAYPIDWQFSLFDYDEHKDVRLDKIEGSLVYKK